jgi:hypothetical protein
VTLSSKLLPQLTALLILTACTICCALAWLSLGSSFRLRMACLLVASVVPVYFLPDLLALRSKSLKRCVFVAALVLMAALVAANHRTLFLKQPTPIAGASTEQEFFIRQNFVACRNAEDMRIVVERGSAFAEEVCAPSKRASQSAHRSTHPVTHEKTRGAGVDLVP